ncbi:Beta-eliminating lyase [Treponema phagedenis F0421]|uniref:threonine aldolase family protein n=1 Tax=Treponema phagedenis TaxID=162 RepID=UPI0001F63D7B|nr:GntG family PLP-dependent aldolase [Treponema phagedenis]EFW38479.1 Beta-eliminating lyase [Treponema phagedenis F0421]
MLPASFLLEKKQGIVYTFFMKYIDLRSDTVTQPTQEMRTAMAEAEVGDDVYGDDPTVIKLETFAADLVGKEAALFVPSGTFGNQLALFTHCPRGSEVILDEECHIVQNEVVAPAIIAGVQLRTIDMQGKMLSGKEIEKRIRVRDNILHPKTSLICVETAHSNGNVFSIEELQDIRRCADRYKLPIHLDGARLFNAAVSLGVEANEITRYADSVMLCLSKGLCAPVGAMLAGSKEFIAEARKKRKIMGGGLRQAGILAAAGLIALRDMRGRLSEDHKHATALAQALKEIPQLEIAVDRLDINFVFFKHKEDCTLNPDALVDFMETKGILINSCSPQGWFRFATHYHIGMEEVEKIVNAMREFYA